MNKLYKFFIAFFLLPSTIFSQLEKVYMPPPDYIGSAVCSVNDYPYLHPIVKLGEKLFISFDDLYGDEKTYYYRIRRYDENWQPSGLMPIEYVDGYDQDMIQNEENSTATVQTYTHYAFEIPNENTRITKSGNYLIEILNEDEEPVFNFPVIVYENAVPVSVSVHYPSDISLSNSHQFVTFTLHTEHFPIADINSDLTAIVLKNENLFDVRRFDRPTFISQGRGLRYYYPDKALFQGGGEFHSFETRNLRGYNRGLDSLKLNDFYDAYVMPFWPAKSYEDFRDIDGSFVIKALQAGNPDTEGDYMRVHFRVPAGEIEEGKKIYVIGRFNNWQTNEQSLLKRNGDFYTVTAILKQGYYDYYFVGRKPDGRLDWAALQPSFSETENRYTVLVYYHPQGARFTRVIGMGQAVSKPLKQ